MKLPCSTAVPLFNHVFDLNGPAVAVLILAAVAVMMVAMMVAEVVAVAVGRRDLWREE